jgi:hypothetical protein
MHVEYAGTVTSYKKIRLQPDEDIFFVVGIKKQ